ncbi:DUF488 family protein [Halobaculum sp. MBLA0143]|uniref:DUF488 domain-containing protein n=1 Tax=Halobaculum sp. MBLA0143 TaxID=3079933 RepID=UPI0035241955
MARETEIYTIGFTKKGAAEFFGLLERASVERLIDVRVRNRSQLSGFAKRDDLKFFLEELLGAAYEHRTELAPTEELLDAWRDDEISWAEYERRFYELLADRAVEDELNRSRFEAPTVLLCSEHEPDHCHRRIVVEYLDDHWGATQARHLVE